MRGSGPRVGLAGVDHRVETGHRAVEHGQVFQVAGRGAEDFYRNPQWADLGDWQEILWPFYDTAERMLGVVPIQFEGEKDKLLREIAGHLGCEDTFQHTRVGIYFGEPGKTVADPFFDGEGPPRTGCKLCGSCILGCRHGAKNTLMKNYLWFAEKRGARILPERTVTDIRPRGAEDGSDGTSSRARRREPGGDGIGASTPLAAS